MNCTTSSRKMISTKTCAWIGCINTFTGSQFQKYCNDPRCKIQRQETNKDNRIKKRGKPFSVNRILSKARFGVKLKHGIQIKLRCKAFNGSNSRCTNTFVVTYDRRRETYPSFCERHTNLYQRERFKMFKEGVRLGTA